VLRRATNRPGHIFNLGHGVQPDTDPDLLRRLVGLVHAESER
jgi:uroporphyrinogen decarboxylase